MAWGMHTALTGMVLALCTGCLHAYPQFYGLVVIMYVIGHSLCYPMGYDLPSPRLAQSLHPAYAMPPPSIGAPCPLTWCGSHPPVAPVKQKGPARYANWRGCNRHYPVYNIKYLLISLLTVSHNGLCCIFTIVRRIDKYAGYSYRQSVEPQVQGQGRPLSAQLATASHPRCPQSLYRRTAGRIIGANQ